MAALDGRGRVQAGLTLFAVLMAGGHLGPLSGATSRLAAALAISLAGVSVLLQRSGPAQPRGRSIAMAAAFCVAALAGLPRVPLPDGPVLLVALLATLAALFAHRQAELSTRMAAAALASLVLCIFQVGMNRGTAFWTLVERCSRLATESAGTALGARTSLGSSVAGAPVLVLLGSYLLLLIWRSARGSRAILWTCLAWLVAVFAAGWGLGVPVLLRLLLLAGRVAAFRPSDMPIPSYPASLAVFLPMALCAAGLLIVLSAPVGRPREAGLSPAPAPRAKGSLFLAAAGSALLMLLASFPPFALPATGRGLRVSLLDSGMVGWQVPQPELLGLERAGMFGLLPRALEAAGFEVVRSRDALSEESLAASRVVVVINPKESFPQETRDRLDRFVVNGGGLVVLGDHTDLEGIMTPLNELAGPYGVSFQFDSAFTPHHWVNNSQFRPDPLTRGLDDSNNRFQQSTGASVKVGGGAEPLAVARWGFSDAGDRINKANAFLGDYIYQSAEPLGDIVVVAAATRGRGRVIVFGDTSAFQNNAVPHSWPFITRVFQAAAARPLPLVRGASSLALGAWMLAGLALAILGGLRPAAALLAGGLCGASLAGLATPLLEPRIVPADSRLALVDAGHANAVSSDIWEPASLGGLNLNLARNGFLALTQRLEADAWLDRARVLVSVAPRRAHTAAELAHLRQWIESGGQMVLAVGWEEKAPSQPLLDMAQLDIAPIPLGPVPILRKMSDDEVFQRLQLEPHFAKAWPITGADPARDVLLYVTDSGPLVVRRPMGHGAFTLIADAMFLQNRTLEEEGAAWQGNVSFLRRILEAPRDAGAIGAQP